MTSKARTGHDSHSYPPAPLLKLLKESDRTLIVGHQNPDGDALGSALALAFSLLSLGREVVVGLSGMLAPSLDFLIKDQPFVVPMDYSPDLASRYDLLVLVDCQAPFRVWPEAENIPKSELPACVCIDHHSAGRGPQHFEVGYIDHRASATAELIFKVVEALEVEFSPSIVQALLAGLISDTGSFSQGNSTSECLRQASVLVGLGGNIEKINQHLKRNWSPGRMKLLVKTLDTLTLHHDGRLASLLLTEETLKKSEASLSEAEGLVEYPLLLAGVDMGVLLRITGQGQTKVSLRCRSGLDVRELAKKFGGGGHVQAAAYLDDSPDPAEALNKLLAVVKPFLTESDC
ncbi:MAG: DHH family phosphoesterase [Deltaproteobacteria bacterium]|jgi:phosphoesterase RecJ-like protein|nr:DHH family phosphoesterase [Deltaproteobacteria bacterium]